MSASKLPIASRIESILRQEATTGVPDDVSIWPSVLEASAGHADETFKSGELIQPSARNIQPLGFKARQPILRQGNRLFAGAAVAITFLVAASIIALLTLTSLMNPPSVSAAKILANAEAAIRQGYTGGVHSTHAIVTVRFRNSPSDPFMESQSEWWDQVPDKSRTVSTYRRPNNSESWAVLGKVGNTKYTYSSGEKVFRIDTITRPATTLGTDTSSATGEAASVGPFSAYDAVLTGTESILGRKAYVVDLTLKGNLENAPNHLTVPQYRKQVWIDAESYIILQEYDWDRDGILLYESRCQKLEINPSLDAALFEFSSPEGYRVVDKRSEPSAPK